MSLARIEDVENFEVNQILPVITCDYESLRKWAQGITDKYQGLLITEAQIPEIKKDMAELNKIKAKIERARIDAVKAVSAPIKEFEAQIKSIVGIFEDTYSALGKQVKTYENASREEKLGKIQNMIDEQITLAIAQNLEMRDKISVAINERWLNKTVTLKTVGEEIAQSIEAQIAAERERQRIEKAQAERRLLIENTVKAANEKYGANLPLYPFMEPYYTNLEKDAADIVAIIEKEAQENAESRREREAFEARREQELTRQEIENGSPEVEQGFIEANPEKPLQPEPQKSQNLIMIRMTALFTPEQEDKVREILNQNHFMKIVRQLQGIGVDVEFSKEAANEPE